MSNLLNNPYAVLTIIAITAVVTILLMSLVTYLRAKKGIDVSKTAETIDDIALKAGSITGAIAKIAPNMPGLSIIQKLISYAETGAKEAEQLCKILQLPKDQRKQEALQYVYDALKLEGIEVTSEVARIADGAVEAAVYALAKSNLPAEAPIQEQVTVVQQ